MPDQAGEFDPLDDKGKSVNSESPIRPVAPGNEEKILSGKANLIGNLLVLYPLVLVFGGVGVPLLALRGKPESDFTTLDQTMLVVGVVFAIYGCWIGLAQTSKTANAYLCRRARGILLKRRERVLDMNDPELIFVQIVPRENWGRPMIEDASDVGFLKLDSDSERVLYEGQNEQWILSRGSLWSGKVESFTMGAYSPGSIKRHLVVLQIMNEPGRVEERCLEPRYATGKLNSGKRLRRVRSIEEVIRSFLLRPPRLDDRFRSH